MELIVKNARIVAELARLFPFDPLSSVFGVLDMPIIDKNNAIWYAQGAGLIAEHSKKQEDPIKSLVGEMLQDPEISRLKDTIIYTLTQVSKEEGDMSEGQLTEWLTGYKAHIVAIALRQLIEDKEIVSYTVVERAKQGKSNIREAYHVFYSLKENEGENWGLKQFKDQSSVSVRTTPNAIDLSIEGGDY